MLGDHPITPVLSAKDLVAAPEFYHDKLGLEIATENEDAIVFTFAWAAWIIDPGKNALGILQLKQ